MYPLVNIRQELPGRLQPVDVDDNAIGIVTGYLQRNVCRSIAASEVAEHSARAHTWPSAIRTTDSCCRAEIPAADVDEPAVLLQRAASTPQSFRNSTDARKQQM